MPAACSVTAFQDLSIFTNSQKISCPSNLYNHPMQSVAGSDNRPNKLRLLHNRITVSLEQRPFDKGVTFKMVKGDHSISISMAATGEGGRWCLWTLEAWLTAEEKWKALTQRERARARILSDKKLVKMSLEKITGKWCARARATAAERASFRSEVHELP